MPAAATLGSLCLRARIDGMIEIMVNGERRNLAGALTVAQLLEELKVSTPAVAVEVNLELIPRSRHAGHELCAGDQVEIVTFKGGG